MLVSQLRGKNRDDMKKRLLAEKPGCVRSEEIGEANDDIIKAGNLQTIYSFRTLRNARSEGLAKNDLSMDDFDDVKLHYLQDQVKDVKLRFYQATGLPFYVLLFSYDQVALVCREKKLIMHLDATGLLIRNLFKIYFIKENRLFLYRALTKISNTSISVFDIFASQHDTCNLAGIFLIYKNYVIQHFKIWPIFQSVVTDYSMALISSILLSFNSCSLSSYLDYSYKWSIKGKVPYEIIMMKLCYAHLMKCIVNNAKVHTKTSEQKIFFIYSLNKIIYAATYNIAKNYTESLLHILYTPELTSNVQIRLQILAKSIEDKPLQKPSEGDDISEVEEQNKTIYANSPFYIYFDRIRTDVKKLANQDCTADKNLFYNPGFGDLIMKKYLAYFPLITSYFNTDEQPLSNLVIKNSFRNVKQVVMNCTTNMKVVSVCERIRGCNIAITKELLLKIPNGKRRKMLGKEFTTKEIGVKEEN